MDLDLELMAEDCCGHYFGFAARTASVCLVEGLGFRVCLVFTDIVL